VSELRYVTLLLVRFETSFRYISIGKACMKERLLDVSEYKKRKLDLEGNTVVRQPLPRLDVDIIPRKSKSAQGRKFKYTPTTLRNNINKYLNWVEETDQVPSIKGMMIYLKMYKDAFYKYIQHEQFKDILEHTRLIIAEWAESEMWNTSNAGLASARKTYGNQVLGWTDKSEVVSTVNHIMTKEQATAKIEMLAPKLLELMKNNNLVNQLVLPEKVVEAELVEKERRV
jgi:hypothetical protein